MIRSTTERVACFDKCPETSTDFAPKPAHLPRKLNIHDPFSENVAKAADHGDRQRYIEGSPGDVYTSLKSEVLAREVYTSPGLPSKGGNLLFEQGLAARYVVNPCRMADQCHRDM
jgi:hypothetical protein